MESILETKWSTQFDAKHFTIVNMTFKLVQTVSNQ